MYKTKINFNFQMSVFLKIIIYDSNFYKIYK